jgi:hypothetical protein
MISIETSLDVILSKLANTLDITDSDYDNAKTRYKSVSNWLSRDESTLKDLKPRIYSQGSFRLGTVIKPLSGDAEYDVDLVAEFNTNKLQITQQDLKKLLKKEVQLYAERYGMVEPVRDGKRCVVLNYAEDAKFHLDLLPALPDSATFLQILENRGYAPDTFATSAIAITDVNHPRFKEITSDWYQSNPRGYSDWFKGRMAIRLNENKQRLAKRLNKSIEEIPDHLVKTPLQVVIQLLKRHRDIVCDGHEDQPISIIITTLAALAYQNEADVLSALTRIVSNMEQTFASYSGIILVPNPVNPLENFADKWSTKPQRQLFFLEWLRGLQSDFQKVSQTQDSQALHEALKPLFGAQKVEQAFESAGISNIAKQYPAAVQKAAFDVCHKEQLPWPVLLSEKVKIRAQCKQRSYFEHFESNGVPLPKNCPLRFRAEPSRSGNFSIHWQVVNTGSEAEATGGLRGEICTPRKNDGKLERTESTSYTGRHWVECFVVRDGICTARSGEYVVNIE